MRIALDAMGGDHAPAVAVQGAIEAVEHLQVEVILVGDEGRVKEELARRTKTFRGLEVLHAPEVIGYDEAPVAAIRRKKNASLPTALRLVKEGQAEACVSAGSTGALLAGGLFIVGRLKGIERPALGAVLPTRGASTLLIDVGANADNRPNHLLQFGLMGSIYAQEVLKRPRPKVALLNIGTEKGKGNEVTKEAYELLRESGLNFIGNLEARDLPSGAADVVVADGFTGNVALKLYEGVAATVFDLLKEGFMSSPLAKAGALLAKGALRGLKSRFDYSEVGGAPLLGLKAPVIKCHGSSNSRAIMNGIRVAKEAVAGDSVAKLAALLAQQTKA